MAPTSSFTGSDRGIEKSDGEGFLTHFSQSSPDCEMPILHHFDGSPILGVPDLSKPMPTAGTAKIDNSDTIALTTDNMSADARYARGSYHYDANGHRKAYYYYYYLLRIKCSTKKHTSYKYSI